MTFDLDAFTNDLRRAASSDAALPDIRTLLETVVRTPDLADALPVFDDEETLIFEDSAISIWHCVYHPGHQIPPHDHQMPAIIGIYEGRERNDFFQADPDGGVRKSSEIFLGNGETLSIGPNAIHAVACVSEKSCKGFHVYLGELTMVNRSLFDVRGRRKLPFTALNYEQMKQTN